MKLMVVIVIIIGLILVTSGIATSVDAGHDVLLEKLISIQKDVNDLKVSVDSTTVKRESQIQDINKEIVLIKIEQATQSAKLNIVWGIFGTIAGGGSVAFGTYVKKRNGKTKET